MGGSIPSFLKKKPCGSGFRVLGFRILGLRVKP